MPTIASHSSLNISETIRDRGLIGSDVPWPMVISHEVIDRNMSKQESCAIAKMTGRHVSGSNKPLRRYGHSKLSK